jgi:hypothetical protein
MNRADKLTVLTKLISGQTCQSDIDRLRSRKRDTWFVVVADNGTPQLTDIVETRLLDEQGRKRVAYADFLKNPAIYGMFCIVIDT